MLRLTVWTVVHFGLLLSSWSAAKPAGLSDSAKDNSSSTSQDSTVPTTLLGQTSAAAPSIVPAGLPFRLGDGTRFVSTHSPYRLSLIEAPGGVNSDPSQIFRLYMTKPSVESDQPITISLLVNEQCVGIFPESPNSKSYSVALDSCTNPHTRFQRISNLADSTQACYVNQGLSQQLSVEDDVVVAVPYTDGAGCHSWHHDYLAQDQCSRILTGMFSSLTIEDLLSMVGTPRNAYQGPAATNSELTSETTLLLEQLRHCQPQVYSDLVLIDKQLKEARNGVSANEADLQSVVDTVRIEVDQAFIQSAGNDDKTKNKWKSIGKSVFSLINSLAAVFSKVVGGPISCIYGAACALGVWAPTEKLTKEEASRASKTLEDAVPQVVNSYAQGGWEHELNRYMSTSYSAWQSMGRSLGASALPALNNDVSLDQLVKANAIIDFARLITKSPDVKRAFCVIHTWKIKHTNALPNRVNYRKVVMPESARVYLMAHVKDFQKLLADIENGLNGWQFWTKTSRNPNASC
ncbi:hypothetical protein H4R34_003586 [Dimargaris verticillata]|uniref:Uncharacterized protein n=1 Tax=Dimargaris verticillata TaxID=2761393 RepID=A0A9W8B1Z3_9FUNG|nr:hypothetical protein H4R34_003586 [Dimargaris verticillata]